MIDVSSILLCSTKHVFPYEAVVEECQVQIKAVATWQREQRHGICVTAASHDICCALPV
jgi:hypothetical protein